MLIRWTKGFGNPNTEGKDCAEMFRQSLKKFNVPITLSALINDTTGTLIASNYVDPSTKIAVIFGTGCNAAYMETVGNIPKMKGLGLPDDQEMAINCEWGAFDSFEHTYLRELDPTSRATHGVLADSFEPSHLLLARTKYDVIIDETSNKPHEQVSCCRHDLELPDTR